MTLVDLIAADVQTPTIRATLDGRALDVLSATVDLGYDIISSRATLLLPAIPSWNRFRSAVDISAGYSGQVATIFRGFVEDDDRLYSPLNNTITAAGPLRLSQYQVLETTGFLLFDDGGLVEALLVDSGIFAYDIETAGLDIGTVKQVQLKESESPWDLINQLDQVTGHKTFDAPTLVLRRYVAGVPSASSAFTYTEGDNVFSARRMGTMRGIHNRVVVYGLPQTSGTPGYYYQASNPLVPNPPGFITYEFRSDLIETTAIANNVARRLIGEMNRASEDIELDVPGNPLLVPTMTIALVYPTLGINSATRFFVKHVTHQIDESGFITRLVVTGGLGNIGEGGDASIPGDHGTIGDQPDGNTPGPGTGPGSGGPGPTQGLPIAQFITKVTRETYDVGGVPTDMWTVFADASGSVDTDTPPGSLTYAWSNSANADTGTGMFYGTAFTLAQMTAGVTITLAVTDSNGDTDTITQTVSLAASTILVRDLYVAAGSRAEATPDGGKTWNTWTPVSGTVVSTPEIAGNISYFGLSDGKLYYTTDRLATAPTLAHTFGSQVECIWINEYNANRVTVGLASGEVWQTNDGSSVASATWTLLSTQAAAVLWIVESGSNQGELRIATGSAIRISFDNGANWSDLITWSSDTARKVALSFFTNYGSASVGAGETNAVQTEAGGPITFPAVSPAVEDVRALTHHIREDVLYAADLNSTTLRTWEKAAGASVFTAKATEASAGQPNHMIRDGDSQLTHYVAADEGLYKTFNGFVTIVRLRDYTGGSLIGYQVGYGAITTLSVGGGGSGPPGPPTGGGGGSGGGAVELVIVSNTSDGTALDLWNGSSNDPEPDGWTEVGFDDSSWMTPIVASNALDTPEGATPLWVRDPSLAGAEEMALFRHEFTIPSGTITTATLYVSTDDLAKVWINNVQVLNDAVWSTGPEQHLFVIEINPSLLLPGQTNLIAAWSQDKHTATTSPQYISWRLEIS